MVYDDDWQLLCQLYGSSIGAGTAAKKIIRAWRLRVEAKVGHLVDKHSRDAALLEASNPDPT